MILAGFAAVLAGMGVVQALAGAVLVGRFAAAATPSPAEQDRNARRMQRTTLTPSLLRSAEDEDYPHRRQDKPRTEPNSAPSPLEGRSWGEGPVGGTLRPAPPPNSFPQGEGESSFSHPAYPDTYEDHPPITILKPLHGDEPLLEAALASVCAQDYPDFQVVFGVQDAADTALPVVARIRARFPERDIAVVVDPKQHGANGKISNLINMLPRAKHAVLAIADSDLHVQPDYLARLAEALAAPGTGLVTTLYTGLPAANRFAQKLGATQITHYFLPGALLARAMRRQDCLGATMVLRRATLDRVGGLQALVGHLADDQVLGRLVAALGLAVRLAATVPATTVPEARLRALLRHEMRWARTIRALEPAAFAASVLQYPLFWAMLAVLLSSGAAWSFGVLFLTWVARALAAIRIDSALEPLLVPAAQPGAPPALSPRAHRGDRAPDDLRLEDAMNLADAARQGLAFPCPVWLLPLRDLISVGAVLASYAGRRVEWRGHRLTADTPGRPTPGLTAPERPSRPEAST